MNESGVSRNISSAGLRDGHQRLLQQQTLHRRLRGHRNRWCHGEQEKRKVRNAHTDVMIIRCFCLLLYRSLGWFSAWCSAVPFATAGRSSKTDPRPLLWPASVSRKDCTAIRIECHLLSVDHLGSQEVEHVRKNSFPLQRSCPPSCNDLLVCSVA